MNPQENQGGPGPMRGGEAQAQQGAGADTASHGGHGGMHAGYCHGHGYGPAMAGPPWAAGYMAPWHGPHSHPYAYPYGPGFAPGWVPPVWAQPLLGRRRGRRRRPLQEPRRWASSTTDL